MPLSNLNRSLFSAFTGKFQCLVSPQTWCMHVRAERLIPRYNSTDLNFFRAYSSGFPFGHSRQAVVSLLSRWQDTSIFKVPRHVPLCRETRTRMQSTPGFSTAGNDISEHSGDSISISSPYISTLSGVLECTPNELLESFEKFPFLTNVNLDIMTAKVQLLRSYEVPVKFLKDNIRFVHQRSETSLGTRLEMLKTNGILHSSVLPLANLPHVLECNNKVFNQAYEKLLRHKKALEDCEDQVRYLQYRLKCSEREAVLMIDSYPLERNLGNDKLKELLDFFLVEAKLSPEFVKKHRKLFHFSPVRLRERWNIFRGSGVTYENSMVYAWCLTAKDFEDEFIHGASNRKGKSKMKRPVGFSSERVNA